LLKHKDRLMYGSDEYANANRTWDEYPGVIARYRKIAGQIPAAVAKKISWDNAAALYGSR
jgi:predicted TIM-barrel fold metal-dependent hydrolase